MAICPLANKIGLIDNITVSDELLMVGIGIIGLMIVSWWLIRKMNGLAWTLANIAGSDRL